MQQEILEKKVAEVGEEISPVMAATFVKAYAEKNPAEAAPLHIGRNIIEEILAQPGCCGIRFYNAINELGQRTLVYVGVDESGKDMLQHVAAGRNGSLQVAPSIVADRAGSAPGNGSLGEIVWEFGIALGL